MNRKMLIVEWAPITETEDIPPSGKVLAVHLDNKKRSGEICLLFSVESVVQNFI